MSVRDVVKLVYKVGMTVITLALIGLAYLAYRDATPANQLLLMAGILGILALMSGLSITKLDDQDARAASYRSMLDDVRMHTKVSVHLAEPGVAQAEPDVPDGATDRAGISVSFAEPEVHHVDSATLDTAKRLAKDGSAIDDICRTIDREHDSNDPVHQEAFRRVVKAMIEQA